MGYKRCAIYAFYDKDGYVDRYVYNMLDAIKEVADTVYFVANGLLQSSSCDLLTQKGILYITRPNKGYDIEAYKEGIFAIGWDVLSQYDEVILVNNTIIGPLYPLQDLFLEMQQKDVDFWGITRHPESHMDIFSACNDYGFLPEHIQSFFVVCRKNLITSYEFRFYWDNLPEIKTYNDAVYRHEAIFTKYFSDMGFTWDVYVHAEDMEYLTLNPMIYYPRTLIEKYKCPFFKRRVFFNDYNEFLQNTTGQPALELYDYLKENKLFDLDMLWENLLRTCNLNDLFKAMHLNYTLSSTMSHREEMRQVIQKKKVAVILHIYFIDLLDDTYRYVSQIPDCCDIYITTSSEITKRAIEERFADITCNHMEIRMIKNRGRDVASILVGVKDIVADYEYLCFAHDKKSSQVLGSVGESFSYKCFENTLYSEDYIYNIIETFENNPRLGLLCPPEPNHADYYPTIGWSWGNEDNLSETIKLAKEMNISVPFDSKKDAVAPFGSFFWFKYEALKAFYDRGWEYEDFPAEPLPADGTISHAIERIRPFVAQQAGYYTAFVMVDKFARIEYTNLRMYVENINRACYENGFLSLHHSMVNTIGEFIHEKFN